MAASPAAAGNAAAETVRVASAASANRARGSANHVTIANRAGSANRAGNRRRSPRRRRSRRDPSPPPPRRPRVPSARSANAAAGAGAGAARAASASTTCCCRPPPAAGRSSTARAARPARRCCASASELAGESQGPDPIALLIDPSPEELADWKREAPRAEIVSAGQARHADDALAQAARRAGGGEDVIVLIDSLTRFAEAFASPEEARKLFDAGLGTGGGTLTVVAALERPA